MLFPAAPLSKSGAAFFYAAVLSCAQPDSILKKGSQLFEISTKNACGKIPQAFFKLFYTFFTILRQRFPQFHAD
ncbi:MAG: hypothetical protein DBX39_00025, partial [Bacillota bacterium]